MSTIYHYFCVKMNIFRLHLSQNCIKIYPKTHQIASFKNDACPRTPLASRYATHPNSKKVALHHGKSCIYRTVTRSNQKYPEVYCKQNVGINIIEQTTIEK